MIDRGGKLPVKRQCELLSLNRTGVYYTPRPEPEENLRLMRRIGELHLKYPYYGARRIAKQLARDGIDVGQLHVRSRNSITAPVLPWKCWNWSCVYPEYGAVNNFRRLSTLMRRMGIDARYRKPRTSIPARGAMIRPYLLEGLRIERPNQVWATDITYLPVAQSFLYLTAILDIASRKVLAWRLSNTLTTDFCLVAPEKALARFRVPEFFNTDQGCQFTSEDWIKRLEATGSRTSMDGKGRWVNNVFIERLWRSVKYEDVYVYAYRHGREARERLAAYFETYNHKCLHQSLDYRTPDEVYFDSGAAGLPLAA